MLDFPSSPTVGQVYAAYTWDGVKWVVTAVGSGGGATVLVSDTLPAGAPDNALWWNSVSGVMYLRYNDGTSTQWVPITIGPQGPPGTGSGPVPPLIADGQAYADLRRGMFIHYNMATFTGIDHTPPSVPNDTFNPSGLNISQWLDVAVNFGAAYAHLTVKHEDGFCLWPTTTTTHGIANTTWYSTHGNPDIAQIFVNACRSHGVLPCLYFSIADTTWETTHPGYTAAAFRAYAEEQVTELLDRYGPIAAVWIDSTEWHYGSAHPWGSSAERAAFFHNVPNGTQTGTILVNNGHTGSLADSDVVEYEETMPPADANPKESCWSLPSSWFWQSDTQTMREAGVVKDLILTNNARNSAALINIPPNTSGVIPAQFIERLREIKTCLGEMPRVSPNNMTSDTAPSPYVASASTEYADGFGTYSAFHAFTLSPPRFWSASAMPAFIKIDLGSSQACSQYTLQTRADAYDGQWMQWSLDGSNDNSSWTALHAVTLSAALEKNAVRFYTMTTPGTYRYWRWTITSTVSGIPANVVNIGLYV